MKKSDEINELAAALSKAQSQIRGAIKDSVNPFFKSHYADLNSIWEAIRDPMTQNGLAVSQPTGFNIEGNPIVETFLLHSSGQWIMGEFPILAKDATPQAHGSGVSYAKRYALASMFCIPTLDDDGEAAQPRERQAPAPTVMKGPDPKVKAQVEADYEQNNPLAPGGTFGPTAPVESYEKAAGTGRGIHPSQAQQGRAITIAKINGWTGKQFKDCLMEFYNVDTIEKLKLNDYKGFVNRLEATKYGK